MWAKWDWHKGKLKLSQVLGEARDELAGILSLTVRKGKMWENPEEAWTVCWEQSVIWNSTYSQKYLFFYRKETSSSSAPRWNDQYNMYFKAGEWSEHHAEQRLRDQCLQGIKIHNIVLRWAVHTGQMTASTRSRSLAQRGCKQSHKLLWKT